MLVVLSIFLLVRTGAFESRLAPSIPYPVGACDFMQRHGLAGNLLNDFDWGEYLIWQLAPRSKVFIDGRYDTVYPFALIRQYALFKFGLPHGAAMLGAYPHDFVLMPSASGAARLMDSRADWKLIYRDRTARLYAPQNSAAARIPGVPVDGVNPPATFP